MVKRRSEDLLKQLGFSTNPFNLYDEGEDGTALESYFFQHPVFFDFLGDARWPENIILITARGAGKSIIRKAIELYCLKQRSPVEGVLDVPYTNFNGPLMVARDEGRSVDLAFHVDEILRCAVDRLLHTIGEVSIQRWVALSPGELSLLKAYVQRYSLILSDEDYGRTVTHLLKSIYRQGFDGEFRIDLSALFSTSSEEIIASLPPSLQNTTRLLVKLHHHPAADLNGETYLSLAHGFLELLRRLGFRAMYVLVDRLDENSILASPQAAADFISPLLTDLKLLDESGLAFKIFLPQHMEHLVEFRDKRIAVKHLVWSDDELLSLLIRRLSAFSPLNSMRALCEPALGKMEWLSNRHPNVAYIDAALVRASNHLPINLMLHCRRLLETYDQSSHLGLINEQDLDQAVYADLGVDESRPEPDTSKKGAVSSATVETTSAAQQTGNARNIAGDLYNVAEVQYANNENVAPGGTINVYAANAYDVSSLINPYLGLKSFTYAERKLYAGREDKRDEALAALTNGAPRNLLFVIGASGCGKSSFVQAGLVPALVTYYQDKLHLRVRHARFSPGIHPMLALATELVGMGLAAGLPVGVAKRIATPNGLYQSVKDGTEEHDINILVIDQFEELFTQSDEIERDQLLELLDALPPFDELHTHIIITMRADYRTKIDKWPKLKAAARERIALPAMSVGQVRDAILQPIEAKYPGKGNSLVEPALLKKLAEDAAMDPTYLPLLQVTLRSLWAGGSMKREHYDDLTTAIEEDTKQVYNYAAGGQSRSVEEKDLVLNLMLALVKVLSLEEPRHDARRGRARRLLVAKDQDKLGSLIDELVARRLLSEVDVPGAEDTVINLIHETLISSWPMLRETMLDKDRRELLWWRTRFEQGLADWTNGNRDEKHLLTGARLEEAKELEASGDIALATEVAREFLHQSLERYEVNQPLTQSHPPGAEISSGRSHARFWQQLRGLAEQRNIEPRISRINAGGTSIGSGQTLGGITFNYVLEQGKKPLVELWIETRNKERNKRMFDALRREKAQIERDFGAALAWERRNNRNVSAIRFYIKDSNPEDERQWPSLQGKMLDAMSRLYKAVQPHLDGILGNSNNSTATPSLSLAATLMPGAAAETPPEISALPPMTQPPRLVKSWDELYNAIAKAAEFGDRSKEAPSQVFAGRAEAIKELARYLCQQPGYNRDYIFIQADAGGGKTALIKQFLKIVRQVHGDFPDLIIAGKDDDNIDTGIIDLETSFGRLLSSIRASIIQALRDGGQIDEKDFAAAFAGYNTVVKRIEELQVEASILFDQERQQRGQEAATDEDKSELLAISATIPERDKQLNEAFIEGCQRLVSNVGEGCRILMAFDTFDYPVRSSLSTVLFFSQMGQALIREGFCFLVAGRPAIAQEDESDTNTVRGKPGIGNKYIRRDIRNYLPDELQNAAALIDLNDALKGQETHYRLNTADIISYYRRRPWYQRVKEQLGEKGAADLARAMAEVIAEEEYSPVMLSLLEFYGELHRDTGRSPEIERFRQLQVSDAAPRRTELMRGLLNIISTYDTSWWAFMLMSVVDRGVNLQLLEQVVPMLEGQINPDEDAGIARLPSAKRIWVAITVLTLMDRLVSSDLQEAIAAQIAQPSGSSLVKEVRDLKGEMAYKLHDFVTTLFYQYIASAYPGKAGAAVDEVRKHIALVMVYCMEQEGNHYLKEYDGMINKEGIWDSSRRLMLLYQASRANQIYYGFKVAAMQLEQDHLKAERPDLASPADLDSSAGVLFGEVRGRTP